MTTPRLRRAPARVLLKDRVLVLGAAPDVRDLASGIDHSIGGAVAVGGDARDTVRALHLAYPEMVVLQQPAEHERRVATPAAPFPFLDDHEDTAQEPLFPIEQTLNEYLDAQLDNGANAAILPTGHIPASDHQTMTAVVRAANQLDRDDLVLHLPVGHRWLSAAGDRTKLIAAVARSKHPVALSMAHKSDPASQAGVVDGIHALLAATGANVCLWHTDLSALDALANGALGGAVGVTSSKRHIVAPGEVAYSPSKGVDRSPNVLLTRLLRFKKSWQMTRDWFANGGEPSCACLVCAGRLLNRFDSSTPARLEAHRHNLQIITRLHRDLLAAPYRNLRWADMLADAEMAHQSTAVETGVMTIKPEGALKHWIRLNPPPDAASS